MVETIFKVQHKRTRMFLGKGPKGEKRWVRDAKDATEFVSESWARIAIPTATKREDCWILPRRSAASLLAKEHA